MALIYPKPHAYCKESDFDGQINEENWKAALGILTLTAEIDDKFECMGVHSNNRDYWK